MVLEGKVMLVTGGGMGIGRALCEVAAREGASIVVADFNVDAGEETASALEGAGARALFVKADMSVEDQVRDVIDRTTENFGRLDCACNNAAVSRGHGPVADFEREEFERTLQYCLTNTFLCMKHEIRAMLPHRSGAIVNLSSNASLSGDPYNAPYAAAKGGVNVLTMSAAAEYAAKGIRINAVAPGVTRTPGLEAYMDATPELAERLTKAAPMKRLGDPAEVAEAAVFLCSDRASFITGQVLSVDGGLAVRGG